MAGGWMLMGQKKNPCRYEKFKWKKVKVLVAHPCPTLSDPMDYSPPGSSVQGILQARILKWVAIPFSRGPRDQTWVSHTAGRFFTIWANREVQFQVSVQFSRSVVSDSLWPLQASLSEHVNTDISSRYCCCSAAKPRPTLCDPMDCSTPGFPVLHPLLELAQTHVHWVGDAIQPSHPLFSSCLQSFQASGPFPMRWLFTSGGQTTGASASATVLPMNIQSWFPLGLTSLISLLSKGLSRVFSSTINQKNEFLRIQPSLWSSSHIHTRLLEKP